MKKEKNTSLEIVKEELNKDNEVLYTIGLNGKIIASGLDKKMAEYLRGYYSDEVSLFRESEPSDNIYNNDIRAFRYSKRKLLERFDDKLSEFCQEIGKIENPESDYILLMDSFGTMGGRFKEGFFIKTYSLPFDSFYYLNNCSGSHSLDLMIDRLTNAYDVSFDLKYNITNKDQETRLRQVMSESIMLGFSRDTDKKEEISLYVFCPTVEQAVTTSLATPSAILLDLESQKTADFSPQFFRQKMSQKED